MKRLPENRMLYWADFWWLLGYLGSLWFFSVEGYKHVHPKVAEFTILVAVILPFGVAFFVWLERAFSLRENWWIRHHNKVAEMHEQEARERAWYGPKRKRTYNFTNGKMEENHVEKQTD